MTQPPFKADQIQIQPGGVPGIRTINSNPAGALLFTDTSYPSGITLAQLAALAGDPYGSNVLIVGAGLAYTTIGAAIAAIPTTSSPSNPYLILITPGIYSETIVIEQDGLNFQGVGPQNSVEILNSGANHTITVQAGSSTTPTMVTFTNLTIGNSASGMAAVRAIGGAGSTIGSNVFGFNNCNLSGTNGAYSLWANSVNYITITGGGLQKDSNSLLVNTDLRSPYSAELDGLTITQDPTGTPVSSGSVNGIYIYNCGGIGSITFNNTATTSNTFSCCSINNFTAVGTSGVGGQFSFEYCVLGPVSLDQGSVANFVPQNTSTFGGVTTTNGSSVGGLLQSGTNTVTSASTLVITLGNAYNNTDYAVSLELQGNPGSAPWISSKTTTTFQINFSAGVSLTLNWSTTGGY